LLHPAAGQQSSVEQRIGRQLNGKRTLTSTWNGNVIGGTVSTNGNRINWDNGTYWTRFRVYGSQNN
jgi:hypothetical protein